MLGGPSLAEAHMVKDGATWKLKKTGTCVEASAVAATPAKGEAR